MVEYRCPEGHVYLSKGLGCPLCRSRDGHRVSPDEFKRMLDPPDLLK